MANDLEKSGIPAPGQERRLHFRRPVASMAYVEIGDDNGGIVLNLGEGGLAIQAAEDLTSDYVSRLRFQLSSASDWVNASGEIVWHGESRKTAGIRFLNLPENARARIKNWISLGGSEVSDQEFKEELSPVWESGGPLAESLLNQDLEPLQQSTIDNAGKKEDFWAPYAPGSHPGIPREPATARLQMSTTIRPSAIFRPTQIEAQKQSARSRGSEKSRKTTFLVSFVAAISLALGIVIGNGSLAGFLREAGEVLQSIGQEALAGTMDYLPHGASSLPTQGEPEEPANALSIGAHPSIAKSRAIADAASSRDEPAPNEAKMDPQPDTAASLEVLPDHPERDIWINVPRSGEPPRRLNLPSKAVSASSFVAISSQRSIMVQPVSFGRTSRKMQRLQIGNLTSIIEPTYPPEAIQNQTEGVVKLRVSVSREGEVNDIERLSGSPLLAESAANAISGWHYKPSVLNGKYIETTDNITIEFRLP